MSRPAIGITLWAVVALASAWGAPAEAQGPGGQWSSPYQLSSPAGRSSEGTCLADHYGYAHCFWTETRFADQRTIIQYARFDGAAWSDPNAIFVSEADIAHVSPAIDPNGTLYLAWAVGLSGPAYLSHAPAHQALSAAAWAQPRRIDIPARTHALRIDSQGVLHLVFINQILAPGIYYVRSNDRGSTWTEPVWLDPDILSDHVPDSLSFELDAADGLHVAWFYGATSQTARPDWVRYVHAPAGGEAWSAIVTIDRSDAAGTHSLRAASPVMAVSGQTVHVIWAAGERPYRYHRFSTDAGQTWSETKRLFGELHGQALDGLAVDGAGRVHFLAQIRYPQGIYHAMWDASAWTPPELLYRIAEEETPDDFGDRIHAHDVRPVVRAGNQLVVTFADPPADPHRRLFVMVRTLADVAPQPTVQPPERAATPAGVPSAVPAQATPGPAPTATPPLPVTATDPPWERAPGPDVPLTRALVPIVVLLGGAFVARLLAGLAKR